MYLDEADLLLAFRARCGFLLARNASHQFLDVYFFSTMRGNDFITSPILSSFSSPVLNV